ncbi:MAG: glycosyltransferase family 2 protein [Patescibacteria group bacterium]
MINCSACILTFNSEKTVGRCLESVKDFDDIVILDGGSSDRTLEIAKKYNARVYPQSSGGAGAISDFTEVRERLFSLAKNEWRLWLDSDERLDETAVIEIERIIKNNQKGVLYSFLRKIIIEDKIIEYAYFYPEYCRRLFNVRDNIGLKKGKKVHEDLSAQNGVSENKLKGVIYHNWSASFRDLAEKDARYLALSVEGKKNFPFAKKARIAEVNLLKGLKVFLLSAQIYAARGFKKSLPLKYSWRFIRYHFLYAKKILFS